MRNLLALIAATAALADDTFRPSFVSEVIAPQARLHLPLLRDVCGEGARTVDIYGKPALGCGATLDAILAPSSPAQPVHWNPYTAWRTDGVIAGHFLSPTSEDIALNGYGSESIHQRMGGTLLLTRRNGRWQPVWYKSGVITRHCRKLPLATGRDLLFCEDTSGGAGHIYHELYTLDLARPSGDAPGGAILLYADNYASFLLGGVQSQTINRVTFQKTATGVPRLRIAARHGRVKTSMRSGSDDLPQPRISAYHVDLELTGNKLHPTRQTIAAARLFGYKP